MQCNQCGATVRAGSRVCSNCGARLDESNPRQGRRGSRAAQEGSRHAANRTWEDEGSSLPSQGAREDNSDPMNPMDDPRAPRFLQGPDGRGRRDQLVSRSPRNAGRGGTAGQWDDLRAGDNSPDEPYDRRRDVGRGGPPGPDRRYDDSAEMSAEYSAEMSAEYSAEYPDPRSGQRGGTYDARGDRGRRDEAAPDYGERRNSGSPPQYTPYDRYQQSSRRDQYDRYDQRDRRGPTANETEGAWRQPSGRSARGRGRPEWGSADSEEYGAFRRQNQQPQWGAVQGKGARDSRGRKVGLFVVIGLVLALCAVAVGVLKGPSLLSRIDGGGSVNSDNAPPFVTYTPGPTPTPPTDFKEFDSTRAFYVLDYPTSWTTSSSTSATGGKYDYLDEFLRSSPEASLVVEQAGAFASITRPQIIQAEVQGAEGSGRTFATIANPIATMEIAGEQWLRNDYLITEQGGIQLHMAILACHHNQRGYAIVLLSLANNFSQDSQATFEPMLDSLHFTG